MAGNLGKWPSKRGPISNIGHRMAAERMHYPWRWNGGTLFPNLDVIWGMSIQWVHSKWTGYHYDHARLTPGPCPTVHWALGRNAQADTLG